MNDQTTVRRFAGPSAFLQDRPNCPGEVEAVRAALRRALADDPTAPTEVLAQIAARTLDQRGAPRPTAARLRALVERLTG
jgi:hypothetical protein